MDKILSEMDYNSLIEGERKLAAVKKECERCEAIGLDTKAIRERIAELERMSQGARQQWFPNRP